MLQDLSQIDPDLYDLLIMTMVMIVGIFIALDEPTKPMKTEAITKGF
jgi:hypothetical protein